MNVKRGRFKKLETLALYTFMNGYGHMATIVSGFSLCVKLNSCVLLSSGIQMG